MHRGKNDDNEENDGEENRAKIQRKAPRFLCRIVVRLACCVSSFELSFSILGGEEN